MFDFTAAFVPDAGQLVLLAGETVHGRDGDLGRVTHLLVGSQSRQVEWAVLERDHLASLIIPACLVELHTEASEYVADVLVATADTIFAAPREIGLLTVEATRLARRLPDLLPDAQLPSPSERYNVVDLMRTSDGPEDVAEGIERGVGAGTAPENESRSLVASMPARVSQGDRFAAQVKVVVGDAGVSLELDVLIPADGLVVMITAEVPPSLTIVGPSAVDLTIPLVGDSDPVSFSFVPSTSGTFDVTFSAWLGGTYLGGAQGQVHVGGEQRGTARLTGNVVAPASPGLTEVALKITSRTKPAGYVFELFQSGGFSLEAETEDVGGDVRHRVEELVREMDDVAKSNTRSTDALTRERIKSRGFALWDELVPRSIKEELLRARDSISQLTIYTNDVVPWEMLFAQDAEGHDLGFLVDLFPVSRWVTGGSRWSRDISLNEPAFVVPDDSPENAMVEVHSIWTLLGREHAPVVQDKQRLLDALITPTFDSLHFACHNFFTQGQGSQIRFVDGSFEPQDLARRRASKPLMGRGSLVFLNACRSAGASTSYTRLEDWARAFIGLGAAAVIGTSWAVRDTTAQLFADAVYKALLDGATLGESVRLARGVAGEVPGDSSWLAYTIYGDPQAKLVSRAS